MKKKYFTPEMETIYMEAVATILSASDGLQPTDQYDPEFEVET